MAAVASEQRSSATSAEAVQSVKDQEARFVDLRFTDLFGTWQHFSMTAADFTEELFERGIGFDGSSIRGFQSIDESDMLLLPEPGTIFLDPFAEHRTAVAICRIVDPITGEPYTRDARYVAEKCETYLRGSGIADTAYLGPEAEFFLFNSLLHENEPHRSGFAVNSEEGHWMSGRPEGSGFTIRPKGGYFPCPPVDKLQDIRSEIVTNLESVGVKVEVHHHEVASAGQCEIDMKFCPLTQMGDNLMKYKYVIRNTAYRRGLIACFMPKPLFGDNGSGMHVHMSLWRNGETLMFDENGYGQLSELGRYYIGGLLQHAPALLAFCAPTTNSYRRLVPGYEAPINLIYSQRNRSACVRIPMYSSSPKAKRVEFRAPDPLANPYLCFAACVMAGLDGIVNKTEPLKPVDKDLYELEPEEKVKIPQTPGSLREVLMALQEDNEFLLQGNVFTTDLLNAYINYKLTNECDAVDLRPHPYEFYLYAND